MRRIAETRAQVVCLTNGQISKTLDSNNHAASVLAINSVIPSESIPTTLAAETKDCGQMDIQEETLSKPSQVRLVTSFPVFVLTICFRCPHTGCTPPR
jgi:hypothetical protein